MRKIYLEIILIALIVAGDFIIQNAMVRDYLIGTLIFSQVVLLGMELKTKLQGTISRQSEAIRKEVSVSADIVTSEDTPVLGKVAV